HCHLFTFTCIPTLFSSLFLYCSAHHLDLHSFPTRRSSDLDRHGAARPHEVGADRREPPGRRHVRVGRLPRVRVARPVWGRSRGRDRKSTRLNSSHDQISYAVFCLKKKKKKALQTQLANYCS